MGIIKAFHGGTFFKFLGEDFTTLERKHQMINADVLDAWFDACPTAIEKIKTELPFLLKTSPPTHCDGLIDTIASVRGVHREGIAVAGGSSDLMFYLFPQAQLLNKKVMILDPMYGEYQHIFSEVVKAKLVRYKLEAANDFQININDFLSFIIAEKPEWIVIVNPNSPTGQYLPKIELLDLLKQIPSQIHVVIDETYIEYVDSALSLEQDIAAFSNVMIIKSMSKVYALSGARVAYMIGDKDYIKQLNGFIPPWSVSSIAQLAGIEALKHPSYYKPLYEQTHIMRNSMISVLRKHANIKVYDSVANFFLIELKDEKLASYIFETLLKKQVFIRNCDSMSTQFKNKFLRIAVKNEAQNNRIIDALTEVL